MVIRRLLRLFAFKSYTAHSIPQRRTLRRLPRYRSPFLTDGSTQLTASRERLPDYAHHESRSVMNRKFDLKVVVLTVLLTIGVIGFWEVALRPLFFGWVDARYPGDAHAELRWNIKQRFEHFFISFAVDALVVTMLLRLVHRQQRRLLESEERYRALFEQAGDGIGVTGFLMTTWLRPITKFAKFSV